MKTSEIPLIKKLSESRFERTRMMKCQCDIHDEDDNRVQEVGLVLEWNEEKQVLLDFRPEYWCTDCQIDYCDFTEDE